MQESGVVGASRRMAVFYFLMAPALLWALIVGRLLHIGFKFSFSPATRETDY